MATLNAVDVADMVAGTLRDLGRMKLSQIAQDLQDYPVMRIWLRRDRVAIDSGIGIQRTLMTKTLGAAKHAGLLEQDNVNIGDHLVNLQVDWRHAQTAWGMEVREAMMNSGKALIVNVIEPRRAAAMIDLADELETKAWALPAATNTTDPNGIPYWICTNATTGFTGNLPSGYTASTYAINTATHTNYKNYADTYTNITPADLVFKMRKAILKTKFRPPVTLKGMRGPGGLRYRLYTGSTVKLNLETVSAQQNDQLGFDIARTDNVTTFRNIPIEYIPYFDDSGFVGTSANPIYGIDNNSFFPVMLRGDMFRETGPDKHPLMHNAVQTFVDLTYNYVCVDRRRNFVIATTTYGI